MASFTGFVSACSCSGRVRLIASRNGAISEDPDFVLDCLKSCDRTSADIDDDLVQRELRALDRHLELNDALLGVPSVQRGRTTIGESILRRIAQISQRARPHERAEIASLACRARTAFTRNLGSAVEMQLGKTLQRQLPDREWLRDIVRVTSTHIREARSTSSQSALIAMIVFQPTGNANALSRATER
jgi:hypothetical protein